jgi:glycosyltransferase involved in cell wall biosynthesis
MSWKFEDYLVMHQKIYSLRYTRIVAIPGIGIALYFLQLLFLHLKLIKTGWISKKDHYLRRLLISHIQDEADILFCSAWQLGQQLSTLQGKYVFEYLGNNLTSLSRTQLYDLHWAVHYAQAVTRESAVTLKPLLPSSFPIWRTYFLPLRDPIEKDCDFIKQTAIQLKNRGQVVVILSLLSQKTQFFEHHKVELVQLVSPLPNWFPYRVRRLAFSIISQLQISHMQRSLRSPVLWCFDPEDVELLPYFREPLYVLYDCVDYFSSVNRTLNKKLQTNEGELVRKADVMTVNSHVLFQHHKKKRPNISLVPQGFDAEGLEMSSTSEDLETQSFFRSLAEVHKTKKIISYVGLLSFRVDYQLLYSVIKSLPTYVFCLPLSQLRWDSEDNELTWKTWIPKLKKLPNIIWYPKLKRSQIGRLLEYSMLGLIPYETRYHHNLYSFPMKLFEYFYFGLPVLSTPILELKHYQPYVYLSKDKQEWVRFIKQHSAKKTSSKQKKEMSQLSLEHRWSKKVDSILDQIQLMS